MTPINQFEAKEGNPWLAVLLPVLLTFVAYLPGLSNEFVWDDGILIRDNTHLQALTADNLAWMWSNFIDGNWMPLTQMSLALDYVLGGGSPKLFHFTNLLLHCGNVVLVYFLAFKLLGLGFPLREKANPQDVETHLKARKRAAWFSAGLFGLHPIHVETAAWAFERSNLLCAFFILWGLLAYLDYAAKIGSRRNNYLLCLGFFALALTAKPLAVVFPVVLLLLDYWPLQRFQWGQSLIWLEKVPLFTLSLLAGFAAVSAQDAASAVVGLDLLSSAERVMNAFHSIAFYLWKLALPIGLAVFYPLTKALGAISFVNVLMALGVIAWTVFCFAKRRQRPFLAVAWFSYLAILLPVLGILQVGSQAAADRYLYLSSLPLILFFSGAMAFFFTRQKLPFLPLAAILLGACWYGTLYQIGFWRDSITLWERDVEEYPMKTGLPYANLGNAYKEKNMVDEALKAYDLAIFLGPPQTANHEQKGMLLLQKHSPELAVIEFKKALVLDPQRVFAHGGLFLAYQAMGREEDALKEAAETVRLQPGSAESYTYLGACNFKLGKYDEAIDAFQKAVSLDPENSTYLGNLASAYISAQRYPQAVDILQRALALRPQDGGFYQSLAKAYRQMGKEDLAEECDRKAQSLGAGLTHNP